MCARVCLNGLLRSSHNFNVVPWNCVNGWQWKLKYEAIKNSVFIVMCLIIWEGHTRTYSFLPFELSVEKSLCSTNIPWAKVNIYWFGVIFIVDVYVLMIVCVCVHFSTFFFFEVCSAFEMKLNSLNKIITRALPFVSKIFEK